MINIPLLGSSILVIAAHPDDEILGCGGLLLKNSEAGGKNTVLIVSEGSSAQYPGDLEQKRQRHEQLVSACKKVNVDKVLHWDYPDMKLDSVSHTELNSRISGVLQSELIDFAFVHHPNDVNRDHKVLFSSAIVACRPTPTSKLKGLLTYYVNSSSEWGFGVQEDAFKANLYLDISNVLHEKLVALEEYKSELRDYPHPRSSKSVSYRAHAFGNEVGVDSAEAFQVVFVRS